VQTINNLQHVIKQELRCSPTLCRRIYPWRTLSRWPSSWNIVFASQICCRRLDVSSLGCKITSTTTLFNRPTLQVQDARGYLKTLKPLS